MHEKESSATRAPLNSQFLSGNGCWHGEMCSEKATLLTDQKAEFQTLRRESLWTKPNRFSESDRVLHFSSNSCCPSIAVFLPMTSRSPRQFVFCLGKGNDDCIASHCLKKRKEKKKPALVTPVTQPVTKGQLTLLTGLPWMRWRTQESHKERHEDLGSFYSHPSAEIRAWYSVDK